MSSNASSITRLLSVTNEPEAAAIVAALADRGIVARYVGGYTAGFRAEAPGEVHVLVRQEDLARAADVVEKHGDCVAAIDWSTVDCGDSKPVSEDEANDTAIEEIDPRFLRVSLRTLLVFQGALCVLLGIALSPIATFLFMAFIVVANLALITVGTVVILSRQESPIEGFRYLGSSLVVLGVLFYAVHLIRATIVAN